MTTIRGDHVPGISGEMTPVLWCPVSFLSRDLPRAEGCSRRQSHDRPECLVSAGMLGEFNLTSHNDVIISTHRNQPIAASRLPALLCYVHSTTVTSPCGNWTPDLIRRCPRGTVLFLGQGPLQGKKCTLPWVCGVPTGRYGVLVLVPAPGNITRSGQKGHRSSKMDGQEEGGEDSEDDGAEALTPAHPGGYSLPSSVLTVHTAAEALTPAHPGGYSLPSSVLTVHTAAEALTPAHPGGYSLPSSVLTIHTAAEALTPAHPGGYSLPSSVLTVHTAAEALTPAHPGGYSLPSSVLTVHTAAEALTPAHPGGYSLPSSVLTVHPAAWDVNKREAEVTSFTREFTRRWQH
ncbi:hypothetical protein RRG08_000923 [Elysia crispata]|uniref:Uncharacterized protein n=1 Tax=Elysia crispata TaxID=231223 RepID=A0AAE0Z5W4_9GAST|nr:hypothetical protein RRG08_000923 [Elysia crispata]